MMQGQKSLTLRWSSDSEWGSDRLSLSFAENASQYHISEPLQQSATQITNEARPKIIDALLTLILPWACPQYVIT